jgi:hypothetical protein
MGGVDESIENVVFTFTQLVTEITTGTNGQGDQCEIILLVAKPPEDWVPPFREWEGLEVLWKVIGNCNAL